MVTNCELKMVFLPEQEVEPDGLKYSICRLLQTKILKQRYGYSL